MIVIPVFKLKLKTNKAYNNLNEGSLSYSGAAKRGQAVSDPLIISRCVLKIYNFIDHIFMHIIYTHMTE